MRQLLCKRLSIILFNICFLILSVHAQDTLKTVADQPKKGSTQSAKRPVKNIGKPQPKPAASPTAVASPPAPAGPVDNSLNGQYEDLLKHSWMQQGYKVINPSRLTTLWKSVNDTLNNTRRELAETQKQLSKQASQIATLKEQSSSKTTIPESTQVKHVQVNEIEVLGMSIYASTYNWIVGGTILALALALAIVLFTIAKNSGDSKQHKQLYEEISTEYQAYKAKAKEKELKLARELQTERNTIEELMTKKSEDELLKREKK